MDSYYSWVITASLMTSSLISIVVNCFLLIIFFRRRGLRTVPNRFIINLLITNLLSSLLLIPFLLMDQEKSTSHQPESLSITLESSASVKEDLLPTSNLLRNNISSAIFKNSILNSVNFNHTTRKCLCYFAQSSTTFVCTASIFSILLVGINQYFGVIHSLRYHFYMNKCKSTILILSSWLLVLVFSLLGTLIQTDGNLWHLCDRRTPKHSSISSFKTAYAFVYFIFVILLPFLAICVIYACIYKAAHKNSERMRKSTSTSCNLDAYLQLTTNTDKTVSQEDNLQMTDLLNTKFPKVQSAPNFLHLENKENPVNEIESTTVARSSSDRTNILTSLKHRISNSSVFRYREETRAAKISFIVIFMVLICYIPFGIITILNAELIDIRTPESFKYIIIALLIASNVLSPFLFGYRNKKVKREIGKLLGLRKSADELANYENQLLKPPTPLNTISADNIIETFENINTDQPFLYNGYIVPEVIVTCKENEKRSILKRVCTSSSWTNYKKCNFIAVPDSWIGGESRSSFSSASTQMSSDDG